MRYDELTESEGIKLDPAQFRTEEEMRKYHLYVKTELQDTDASKIWAVMPLNRDPGKFLVVNIRPKDYVIQGYIVNTKGPRGWRIETLGSKGDIYSYIRYSGRGMLASHLQDIGAKFL